METKTVNGVECVVVQDSGPALRKIRAAAEDMFGAYTVCNMCPNNNRGGSCKDWSILCPGVYYVDMKYLPILTMRGVFNENQDS